MATRQRKKKSKRKSKRQVSHPRWGRLLLVTFFWSLIAAIIYVGYLDFRVRSEFEGKRWSLPARVYSQPLELYQSMPLQPAQLTAYLRLTGYSWGSLDKPGSYQVHGNQVDIHTRHFVFWDGPQPDQHIVLTFSGNYLASLKHAESGRSLSLIRLEPALIGSFYPTHREDRILVRLDEVPPALIKALLVTEDRNFYEHYGISIKSIARALLANIRAGATVQGGSTLTQQLVKNFFLTDERSLWRKINEAVMALLLEHHYDKNEILEAYLNEIYLGQDGSRAIHGFGLASHFYFGKPVQELEPQESALLVALVRGASYYNPRKHGKRALKRRNLIISQMAEQGVMNSSQATGLSRKPLGITSAARASASRYPAFLDLVRRQLRRDYADEDLTSEGLHIFSTLDPMLQEHTERRFVAALERLDKGGRHGLNGAAIVANPVNGEVLSVIGSRQPKDAGFNRALDALRPVGSLVKPAVYLAALSLNDARYTAATMLDDSPLTIENHDGSQWQPGNYDKQYHGQVPLFEALVHSYNIPTVRLGMAVGIQNVLDTLRHLGLTRSTHPYPSLFLGAEEFSPIEMTQMYQTLAAGGFRTPLRSIREVADNRGQPLQRYPLDVVEAAPADGVYIVNRILQQVVQRGTARQLASRFPRELGIAGKTGTTDDLRDSWFAGYSGDLLTVAWLGRDDNKPAGFTGASGALQVWADIMDGLPLQPLFLTAPANVDMVWVDIPSGLRGSANCENAVEYPFRKGTEPEKYATCAGGTVRDVIDELFNW
jgi:penicillin-binding protein 1B